MQAGPARSNSMPETEILFNEYLLIMNIHWINFFMAGLRLRNVCGSKVVK